MLGFCCCCCEGDEEGRKVSGQGRGEVEGRRTKTEEETSRRQGRDGEKEEGSVRIHAFSRSRIIHFHQLVARRDVSACIRGSTSSRMQEPQAGRKNPCILKISKRKKKKQASTKIAPLPQSLLPRHSPGDLVSALRRKGRGVEELIELLVEVGGGTVVDHR